MPRPLSLALLALFAGSISACGSEDDASSIDSDPFAKRGEAVTPAELARLREAGGKNMEKLMSGTPEERERAAREMAAAMSGMGNVGMGQDAAQAQAVSEALAKRLGGNQPLTDESVGKFFDIYAKMKAAPTDAERAKIFFSEEGWNVHSVQKIVMKFAALKSIDANPEAAKHMPPSMLPTEAERAVLRRHMARWEEMESR